MSEEKARVRDILRKRKDAMTPEERAKKSGLIARHLMETRLALPGRVRIAGRPDRCHCRV